MPGCAGLKVKREGQCILPWLYAWLKCTGGGERESCPFFLIFRGPSPDLPYGRASQFELPLPYQTSYQLTLANPNS